MTDAENWQLDPMVRLERRLYGLQTRLFLSLLSAATPKADLANDLSEAVAALGDLQARYFDRMDVTLPQSVVALAQAYAGRLDTLRRAGPTVSDMASLAPQLEALMDGLRQAFIGTVLGRQTAARQQAQIAAREIDAISRQIYFISINASVEAARVGEAGRGFSVIGQQIRGLASDASASLDRMNKAAVASGIR